MPAQEARELACTFTHDDGGESATPLHAEGDHVVGQRRGHQRRVPAAAAAVALWRGRRGRRRGEGVVVGVGGLGRVERRDVGRRGRRRVAPPGSGPARRSVWSSGPADTTASTSRPFSGSRRASAISSSASSAASSAASSSATAGRRRRARREAADLRRRRRRRGGLALVCSRSRREWQCRRSSSRSAAADATSAARRAASTPSAGAPPGAPRAPRPARPAPGAAPAGAPTPWRRPPGRRRRRRGRTARAVGPTCKRGWAAGGGEEEGGLPWSILLGFWPFFVVGFRRKMEEIKEIDVLMI